METITIYRADDGSTFESARDCKAYEQLVRMVQAIESRLVPVPVETESTKFGNGEWYVQQSVDTYPEIQKDFLDLTVSHLGEYVRAYITSAREAEIGQAGNVILGRILGDLKIDCLSRFWARLGRIDSSGREWGQLYFVRNPNPKAIKI
jgi:hypothetical protein